MTAVASSGYSSYAEEYRYSVDTLFIEAKDAKGKDITELPRDLYRYKNLHTIVCQHNKIKNVDVLQYMPHLKRLYFKDVKIKTLDRLPPRLEILHCIGLDILNLDNLPNTLLSLHCHGNEHLRTIHVSDNLREFACNNNPGLIYEEEPTLDNIRKYQNSQSTYLFK